MLTAAGKKEIASLNGNNEESFAGCTATTVLITPTEIFCANSGDSRTVLSRQKAAVPLSEDHKPDDVNERKRIYNANGFVEDGRVNGMLALSRALGDFEYKKNPAKKPKDQAVTACPDVKVVPRNAQCDYILLACDGLWDCFSSEEAIAWVHKNIYKGNFVKGNLSDEHFKKGVEGVVDASCAEDIGASEGVGCDNITACLVEFLK